MSDNHLLLRKQAQEINYNNPNLPGLTTVELNVTELCNRTCSFCPRSNPDVYPNQNLHMSLETAKKIRQDLLDGEYKGLIVVSGFGEPMLNNNIMELLAILTQDFDVEVITNGDRFVNGYYTVTELEKTGIKSLIIDSYDGEQQVRLFEKTFATYSGTYRIRKNFDTQADNLIQKYGFNNRGGILKDLQNNNSDNPCYLPMYKILIDWNGDVVLCCNNWSRLEPNLGNINTSCLTEIWKSEKLCATRKDLLQGHRTKHAACENCSISGTAVGKVSADLWADLLS